MPVRSKQRFSDARARVPDAFDVVVIIFGTAFAKALPLGIAFTFGAALAFGIDEGGAALAFCIVLGGGGGEAGAIGTASAINL